MTANCLWLYVHSKERMGCNNLWSDQFQVPLLKTLSFDSDGKRISIKQKKDWTMKKPHALHWVIHRGSFAHFCYWKMPYTTPAASEAGVRLTDVFVCIKYWRQEWQLNVSLDCTRQFTTLQTNSKWYFLHFGTTAFRGNESIKTEHRHFSSVSTQAAPWVLFSCTFQKRSEDLVETTLRRLLYNRPPQCTLSLLVVKIILWRKSTCCVLYFFSVLLLIQF